MTPRRKQRQKARRDDIKRTVRRAYHDLIIALDLAPSFIGVGDVRRFKDAKICRSTNAALSALIHLANEIGTLRAAAKAELGRRYVESALARERFKKYQSDPLVIEKRRVRKVKHLSIFERVAIARSLK